VHRADVLRLAARTGRVNSACTRGDPYDFIFGSAWIFSIRRSSISLSWSRAGAGRSFHS
jgi:hypothetical protein